MKKKHTIVLLFFLSLLLSQNRILDETRFENFWRRTFKQMTFRDPVSFMPYNIKIGYFSFGGVGYLDNWDDILLGDDIYESSPFNLNNINFPDISNQKHRLGVTFELDLLRYNFFKKYQNAIDIELPNAPKWAKELADGKRR